MTLSQIARALRELARDELSEHISEKLRRLAQEVERHAD